MIEGTKHMDLYVRATMQVQHLSYPLTHPQHRELITEKLYSGTSLGNMPFLVTLEEEIECIQLEKAINHVLWRHDGIRMQLSQENGEYRQFVADYSYTTLDFYDFSSSFAQTRMKRWLKEASRRPFAPLTDTPLYYFTLLKTGDGKCGFFFNMHHVIGDGWTMRLIIAEIVDTCWKIKQGLPLEADKAEFYQEFIDNEEKYLQSVQCQNTKTYWEKKMQFLPEEVVLPYNRSTQYTAAAHERSYVLPEMLLQRLREFCAAGKISSFRLLATVMYAYIARITAQTDITTGMLTHNRQSSQERKIAGLFVNVFPLRQQVDEKMTWMELLQNLTQELSVVLKEHSRYPYDLLAQDIREKHGKVPNMLNIILAGQDFSLTGAHMEYCHPGYEHPPYHLLVNIITRNEGMELQYIYPQDMYSTADIERIHGHILQLLETMLSAPNSRISEAALLTTEELHWLQQQDSAAIHAIFTEKTVLDLFISQSGQLPEQIAVVDGERSISYQELHTKSDQLAKVLVGKGIQAGSIIAILLDRSLEVIIAALAIWKAGCAYVPIDPHYPLERQQYILDDTNCPLLLTNSSYAEPINFSRQVLIIDDQAVWQETAAGLLPGPGVHDLAYVIYTSGSTGNPKGVMIEHRGLLNMCCWYQATHNLTPEDHKSQYASFGFDASILEVFPCLISGATLYLIPEDLRLSLPGLNKYFEQNHITVAFLPTPVGEQFMNLFDNRTLRLIDIGGDKLKRYTKRRYKVLNAYGPTEYTVCTSDFEVNRQYDNIPIGKPVWNTTVYIMDAGGRRQPVGVPGEICVAGAGVARGYLNRQELTDERFVADPFQPGQRMYRTGDLGRLLEDGTLEYLGRIDFQVKIRGVRIELGEIEQALLKQDEVHEAVVIDRLDNSGNKYLCAYIVSNEQVTIDKLKAALAASLPDFMIPSYILQLDSLPLNHSGKIDKKALPEPDFAISHAGRYEAPVNEIQEQLANIWQQVLGLGEKPSIDDSFFALGGDSLKVAILTGLVKQVFQQEISFRDVFRYPTIREMSQYIESSDKPKTVTANSVSTEGQGDYPASPAQKRLYFTEQVKGIGTTYNVLLALEILGKVDQQRLAQALDALVARHGVLRTSLELIKGQVRQKVHTEINFKKIFRRIPAVAVDQAIEEFSRPFDLGQAPLFQVEFWEITSDRHILMFDAHHSIFDGSSITILVKELAALYGGEALLPIEYQYGDYALWYEKMLQSSELAKAEEYWLKTFAGSLPVLDLPTDFPRPPIMEYAGDTVTYPLTAELTTELNNFALKHNSTLYMVLVAAYFILLAKYSGQDDITIAEGVSGRDRSEFAGLIGMFVNTLPIRAYPQNTKNVTDFLAEIKETLLSAYEHQDYPFEQLIEKLQLKRDSSRNSLMDIGFVFENMGFPQVDVEDITIRSKPIFAKVSRSDLLLYVLQADENLVLKLEYRTKLFRRSTMLRMLGHYNNILSQIVACPEGKLQTIDMLSAAEKKQLLYDFNRTDADYPHDKTMHQLIEEKAASYPERIAVVCGQQTLTYAALNSQANQLARQLRSQGVGPDCIVGLMLEKCLTMIVAILAIMKAGGCYLPIKPDFPADRIQYMLENSGTKLLLTTPDYQEAAGSFDGSIINIFDEELYSGDDTNLPCINTPRNLIYIIYTSGSTGKPKGVMLEHGNIVRLFIHDRMGAEDYYRFDEQDVWTMFHSFCFDFSVWEIYGALLYGGKLVIVPKEITVNPAAFLTLLRQEKVTVLSQTPGAFYNLIAEELKLETAELTLRYVTFGGEALKPALLKEWRERYPQTQLINMYGITETTVHVTYKEITEHEIIHNISNIGVPIPTLTTYIMDSELQLLPVGVPGEICVGGDGLARGYLGLPELTAEKFVDNPLKPGERIYRSGDLAKLLPNGEMEYLGRIDFQVKIRGFRLELGEVESQLLKHPDIKQAVVLAKDDQEGAKYLVAYLTTERKLTVNNLREHMLTDLPDYMIPSFFVILPELPLTPNGKVDRKALPEPDGEDAPDTGSDFVAARNDLEEQLTGVWRKVLGINKISVLDNFFALGGHSLKAVTLVAELQRDFEVTVNDIFTCQTIANLAQVIKPKSDNLGQRLEKLKYIVEQEQQAITALRDSEKYREYLSKYQHKNTRYASLDKTQVKQYQNILLTGATGYLGVYLLRELLTATKADVFLIVRGQSQEEAWRRLQGKVTYYFGEAWFDQYRQRVHLETGNLAHANLGLDAAQYAEWAKMIDCILNPAALVKHYGHYQEFYEQNVTTVINLLQFAQTGQKKDVHHISTLSIFDGGTEEGNVKLCSEYDTDIGQQSDNYYAQSKFEAEQIIGEARSMGITANIYRVANITIHSETGLLQDNIEENAFYLMCKSFINLGIVTEMGYMDEEIDFTYVDSLAKAIIALFDKLSLVNETFHLRNSQLLRLSEVLTEPSLGLNMKKLSLDEFVGYVQEHYGQGCFQSYIETILLHKGWLGEVDGLPQEPLLMLLHSAKTDQILSDLGFEWPKLNAEVLGKLIEKALDERMHFLAGSSLGSDMPYSLIRQLAAKARLEQHREDSVIFWQGQNAMQLYILMAGHIELFMNSAAGWTGTVCLLGAGEFFGEGSFINPAGTNYVSSEAVLGDAELLSISATDMLKLIEQYPQFALRLLQAMNHKAQKLATMMINIG